MKRSMFAILSYCFLATIAFAPLAAEDHADLVLRGGRVVTLADPPEAQAIAVQGTRIAALGSDEEIAEWIGDTTRVVELDGRLVLPGFIEGHGHFLSLGESKMVLDLSQADSWQEIVDQVAEAARSTPPGSWIIGRGWHQGKWQRPPADHVGGYPHHQMLSRRTPDHPVLLTHGTGHMLFANATAMQLAGVDAQTAELPGGEVLRDQDGNPTGVFRENAMALVEAAHGQAQSKLSGEEIRRDNLTAIRLATETCWQHGITSFQDAGTALSNVLLLRELAAEGKLGVRLWVMLNQSNDLLAANLADFRTIDFGDGFLTVRAIKRMVDGALGTHGAWLLQPYDDLPGSVGHNTTSLRSLARTAELAAAFDYQLCVHAIGDRANREVLDLFEQTLGEAGAARRWRIEHAQHIDPQDIPRFGKLGVIASMQGVHCTSDAPFVIQRLGAHRARTGAYVWRSLLDSGALVINGSDVPVEQIDPLACFYASVTRKLSNGVTFFPEQVMTREEALLSYTRDAAYAAFEEHQKGRLAPGYFADIVVLDRDILRVPVAEISAARVDYTIVGGAIRYQAEAMGAR